MPAEAPTSSSGVPMPIVSPARLHRMIELMEENMPEDLYARLVAAETAERQYAIGITHAAELGADLLAGGAPGLHLYTYNKHEAVIDVLDAVGIRKFPSPRATPTKEHA